MKADAKKITRQTKATRCNTIPISRNLIKSNQFKKKKNIYWQLPIAEALN